MSGRTGAREEPTRAAEQERAERERLARLFAGFGLTPGPHLDRLIGRYLDRVAAGDATSGASEPHRPAVEAAETELRAWFLRVLGEAAVGDGSALLVGRAAWRACGAASRWPDALLAQEVSPELVEAVRAAVPAPVPPEHPAPMLDQLFESWSLRDLVPKPRVTRLLPRRSAAA